MLGQMLADQPAITFLPDIGAAAAQLTGAGVELLRFDGLDQDDAGVWTAPDGDRIAWFSDPDGNVLSVAQFAAG